MVDKKTSNDALVSSILGIFSDLQQRRKRCRDCNELAIFTDTHNYRTSTLFYCDEPGKMSGIDYEEVDDDDEDYNLTEDE